MTAAATAMAERINKIARNHLLRIIARLDGKDITTIKDCEEQNEGDTIRIAELLVGIASRINENSHGFCYRRNLVRLSYLIFSVPFYNTYSYEIPYLCFQTVSRGITIDSECSWNPSRSLPRKPFVLSQRRSLHGSHKRPRIGISSFKKRYCNRIESNSAD